MAMAANKIDETLLALADPTRRGILRRLSNGEARVTEVARPFDISLNAVSKHIRILERANLVRRRVEGREHFLVINPRPVDEAIRWLKTQRAFWSGRLDALEALLKAEVRSGAKTSRKNSKRKGAAK